MPWRARHLLPSAAVACALLSALVGGAFGASHGSAKKVAAKDHFTGRVASATGRYRTDHARAVLDLHVSAAGTAVTITIAPSGCPSAARCLKLKGTLHGTLTAVPTLPDAGRHARVDVSGSVAPLGHVTANGTVAGTGFIIRGQESLTVTLVGAHGHVRLDAQSPPVPGFTFP